MKSRLYRNCVVWYILNILDIILFLAHSRKADIIRGLASINSKARPLIGKLNYALTYFTFLLILAATATITPHIATITKVIGTPTLNISGKTS